MESDETYNFVVDKITAALMESFLRLNEYMHHNIRSFSEGSESPLNNASQQQKSRDCHIYEGG
jgi:hypothetical protein